MSVSTRFGFTNTTPSTHSLGLTLVGPVANYAVTEETADTVVLNNKTAPLDLEEIVTIKTRNISNVQTRLTVQNPTGSKRGVWYCVEDEAVARTEDSESPLNKVDDPIVVKISVSHTKSGNVTSALVEEMLNRCVSMFRRSDGTWRFDDLMRGAERPVVD